jgi:hypothetical protein
MSHGTRRDGAGNVCESAALVGADRTTQLTLLRLRTVQVDATAALAHERLHLTGRRVPARPKAYAILGLTVLERTRVHMRLVHNDHWRHSLLALDACPRHFISHSASAFTVCLLRSVCWLDDIVRNMALYRRCISAGSTFSIS